MLRLAIGIFLVLHGFVYLLYGGHSARLFELRAGLTWPDGSWMFSRLIGNDATRALASLASIVATIGFVAGGAGLLLSQSWWRPAVVATAVFAVLFTIIFWDGHYQHLSDQGSIGLLINAAILVSLLVLEWPQFEF